MFTWLLSATAAGFGAFAGALGAYYLALRKERALKKEQYLCLLLVIHEHLESIYMSFADISEEMILESDGVKFVMFDVPFPNLPLNTEQMLTLMEISPDKQMPSPLIKVQHFLEFHAEQVAKTGANTLPLEFIQQQMRQLQFMLLSVRTQYEQASGGVFPLDKLVQK